MSYKKLKRRLRKAGSARNFQELKVQYESLYKIKLKESRDITGIKKAGRLALDILNHIEERIAPGITTNYINSLVEEITAQQGAQSAPLNYHGFPKSVCTSVNQVICHGIPDDTVLKDGDIVNVDVTPIVEGYYADMSKTFFVGSPGEEAQKIVTVSKECLRRGVLAVKPGNRIGDIGYAIQRYAEAQGCSVVREYVGHGTGFEFHEPPQVPHYGKKGEGIPLVPGMVFTIEPMINLGKHSLHVLADKWTAVTDDGSLSAQFEQTVLVTETGPEILTPFE
ncbi:MAG: methionine aminopeptidase [Deltaproteobacteria bacterium]|nr:type I methionyl aminopeptidase [Deltaproteobacteria bacterium]MBW2076184.1 type I methionyl aminopeptidase [Deltaproteobacteria bacterium]MBW2310408.1 type I methionyl aminopeptidase [Deltaproteobacteria bacterium]RLB32001.1 MAG: methionine aminopeptidase [Deltaproteobacteria bacterium]